jgi:hypothetical protein
MPGAEDTFAHLAALRLARAARLQDARRSAQTIVTEIEKNLPEDTAGQYLSGDTVKARGAYDDLFMLWKSADRASGSPASTGGICATSVRRLFDLNAASFPAAHQSKRGRRPLIIRLAARRFAAIGNGSRTLDSRR